MNKLLFLQIMLSIKVFLLERMDHLLKIFLLKYIETLFFLDSDHKIDYKNVHIKQSINDSSTKVAESNTLNK